MSRRQNEAQNNNLGSPLWGICCLSVGGRPQEESFSHTHPKGPDFCSQPALHKLLIGIFFHFFHLLKNLSGGKVRRCSSERVTGADSAPPPRRKPRLAHDSFSRIPSVVVFRPCLFLLKGLLIAPADYVFMQLAFVSARHLFFFLILRHAFIG